MSRELRQELERLQQRLQALRASQARAEAARAAGADPSEFDAEIAEIEARAAAVLAQLEARAPVGEPAARGSKRARDEDDIPGMPAPAVRAAERDRELALALAMSRDALLAERLSGASRELGFESRRLFGAAPFSAEMQAAFLRSFPTEQRVLDRLFRPGTDLAANDNAPLKFCSVLGYTECVRRLLAADIEVTPRVLRKALRRAARAATHEINPIGVQNYEETMLLLLQHPRFAFNDDEDQANTFLQFLRDKKFRVIDFIWTRASQEARDEIVGFVASNNLGDDEGPEEFVRRFAASMTQEQLLQMFRTCERFDDTERRNRCWKILLQAGLRVPDALIQDTVTESIFVVGRRYQQFTSDAGAPGARRYILRGVSDIVAFLDLGLVPDPVDVQVDHLFRLGLQLDWTSPEDPRWLALQARKRAVPFQGGMVEAVALSHADLRARLARLLFRVNRDYGYTVSDFLEEE